MSWLSDIAHVMPWWLKIAGKIVLSRLPVSGETWQKIGLFSPGLMHRPDYALAVFDKHFRAAGAPAKGFSFLELGPGDSVASAVIGYGYGASRGWLVDSGAYATRDLDFYRDVARRLAESRPDVDFDALRDAGSFAALLERCRVDYQEGGVASLRQIPGASCDLIFSEVVLEHVPFDEFDAVMGELYRILKPGAVASHGVDFRDHLGGGWNNLRFSERLWEAPWFARRSGFYTNRLRLSAMLARARAAGFAVEVAYREYWSACPLARGHLAPEFRGLQDDDLMTNYAQILMRKQ